MSNNPTHVVIDEQQKVQELLKPRYKVLADYPSSPFDKGEVIGEESYYNGTVYHFSEYPHIFKPLQWWEERTLDELPEYIQIDKRVWQVSWNIWLGKYRPECKFDFTNNRPEGYELLSIHWHFYKDKCLPATEQDYLAYKNQSNGK